ncbi:hypothetical protein PsYK624_114800 [Phanerochaete sordida]|uniref:Uncharacterized protein n=1 Tax=Phanerochaete sordida TaxID=48140 RepID=A0A9P3GHT7_9APHY|nr:hypothetical protein PsYK624_114800 [Phanerochaete sordida]
MPVTVITNGEPLLLSSSSGDMCLRISAAHASSAPLLAATLALATFAYTACAQPPPPALDGTDHWALLYAAPRAGRPKVHLLFYERVAVPGAAPAYITRPLLDLAWHVLLDRATRRFTVPGPALDAASAVLRARAHKLLAAQGAHGAALAPEKAGPRGVRWDAWRDPNAEYGCAGTRAYEAAVREWACERAVEERVAKMAQREVTPMPEAMHARDMPEIPDFVEFPDQEEGYDGGEMWDEDEEMPPSDEDWYYCRDIVCDETE